MKILGLGVDIIKNNRIQKSIKNKVFLKRIFTNLEIKSSYKFLNRSNYFAKRFVVDQTTNSFIFDKINANS